MTTQEYNKQIDNLVDKLGCSIFEAQQILADDKKIDKNQAVNFGLTKEQEKQAIKYANVKEHKKPMVLNLNKRERKPDVPKETMIKQLSEFLQNNNFEQVTITNKTKLITFILNGDNYTLMLTRNRKDKKDKKI